MTYTGILRYVDIGSGGWELECSDGTTYTLYGTIPTDLINQHVYLKAKPMAGMGFIMAGNALEVEHIRKK